MAGIPYRGPGGGAPSGPFAEAQKPFLLVLPQRGCGWGPIEITGNFTICPRHIGFFGQLLENTISYLQGDKFNKKNKLFKKILYIIKNIIHYGTWKSKKIAVQGRGPSNFRGHRVSPLFPVNFRTGPYPGLLEQDLIQAARRVILTKLTREGPRAGASRAGLI